MDYILRLRSNLNDSTGGVFNNYRGSKLCHFCLTLTTTALGRVHN